MTRIRCVLLEPTELMVAPHVRIYRNVKTNKLHVRAMNVALELPALVREQVTVSPVGAMWFVAGFGLVVRTPGGDWTVDHTMGGVGPWERSGIPPVVTVESTVRIGNFYGRLRDGFLEECS